jgi:hypothetical protein
LLDYRSPPRFVVVGLNFAPVIQVQVERLRNQGRCQRHLRGMVSTLLIQPELNLTLLCLVLF